MAAVTPLTLHYIYDPLCGWCYAAAPLTKAAAELPGLTVHLHAGGMLAGAARKTITPQWRDYVMPHDHRIAQMTGQPFGAAYFDGLLKRTGTVLDSAPPIAAILAAQSLAGRGLDMLHALQHAHYVDGQAIAERATLTAAAQSLGLDAQAFEQALTQAEGETTRRHIADSRQLLADVGGQGFPTFVLEAAGEDGRPQFQRVDIGSFLGRVPAWSQALQEAVAETRLHAPAHEGAPVCGPDHCVS